MTTQHSHGPNFGRKVAGCPRCQELVNGAQPIQWHTRDRDSGYPTVAEIRAHRCQAAGCGPVCTFGQW